MWSLISDDVGMYGVVDAADFVLNHSLFFTQLSHHDAIAQQHEASQGDADYGVDFDEHDNRDNTRGDILITLPGMSLYVDVSIVHCEAPSYVTRNVKDPIHDRELKKHAKYDQAAKDNRARMFPFVISTHCNFGREALTMLDIIASFAPSSTKKQLYDQTIVTICHSLAQSNADMAMKSYMIIKQHAGIQAQINARRDNILSSATQSSVYQTLNATGQFNYTQQMNTNRK
jgi:hypothetical protein